MLAVCIDASVLQQQGAPQPGINETAGVSASLSLAGLHAAASTREDLERLLRGGVQLCLGPRTGSPEVTLGGTGSSPAA